MPPLDGALRPNRLLDEAASRVPLAGRRLPRGGRRRARRVCRQRQSTSSARTARGSGAATYDAEIACLAAIGDDGLAVALGTARSSSRAAASTGAAIAPTPDVAVHHRDGRVAGPTSIVANGSATTLPPTGSATSSSATPPAASGGSIWKAATSQPARRRPRLAGRPRGRCGGPGLLRGVEAPARQDRSGPVRTGRRSLHADLPGYPGRIAPAADGLLAGAVRAAQPARRVRAARAGLPQAHDGRGAAAVLGGAETAVRPQLLRVAAGRRREASRPAQAMGADHVGRTVRQARPGIPAALQPAEPCRWRDAWRDRRRPSIEGQVFVAARGDGVVVSLRSGGPAEAGHDADRGGAQRDQGVSRRRRP